MHSRVGRQRQASQNSGTVVVESGGRVVARAVRHSRLFSLDFLSGAMFPRKSSPTSPRPRRHHWKHCPGSRRLCPFFPHRGEAAGAVVSVASVGPTAVPLNLVVPAFVLVLRRHAGFLSPERCPHCRRAEFPFPFQRLPGVAGLLTAAVQLPPDVARLAVGMASLWTRCARISPSPRRRW